MAGVFREEVDHVESEVEAGGAGAWTEDEGGFFGVGDFGCENGFAVGIEQRDRLLLGIFRGGTEAVFGNDLAVGFVALNAEGGFEDGVAVDGDDGDVDGAGAVAVDGGEFEGGGLPIAEVVDVVSRRDVEGTAAGGFAGLTIGVMRRPRGAEEATHGRSEPPRRR